MSAEDGDNPTDFDPSDKSEHANRNRTQLEMLRVAVERKKHAAYIDAMLDRRAPGGPATDAEKKDSGPDS